MKGSLAGDQARGERASGRESECCISSLGLSAIASCPCRLRQGGGGAQVPHALIATEMHVKLTPRAARFNLHSTLQAEKVLRACCNACQCQSNGDGDGSSGNGGRDGGGAMAAACLKWNFLLLICRLGDG